MKHATLYRRWRPRAFSQVVGQEPIVRTLKRAIETDRVSHAYLFSGPRGTGKTSTAKVLAMGLNCAEGPTSEPCGKCDSCRSIVSGSSMDVVEMDAASNRGIDEIRDLRDRVNLAPASGRMKVYIIDEVHMLTAEAFNALLKMLEEPPEHVIFVLATTEKHKVLATIISRCQSFDFRRPGVSVIAEKLQEIADAESIEAEPEALTVIAGAGGGSFRDAEGLLDQLSSFAEGKITAPMVRELLGSVGSETLVETTYALHERRAADALRILDRLSNEGRELGQFIGELVSHLRNLMLLPHAPEVALASVGAEEREPLEEQAEAVPTAGVVRMIEALGDCMGRMRRGGDSKLEAELTFLKLARDYAEPSVENLMSRLESLEKAVANGNAAAPARAEPSRNPPTGDTGTAGATSEAVASGPDRDEAREDDGEAESEEHNGAADDEKDSGDGGYEERESGQSGEVGVETLSARWDEVINDLKRQRQALTATVFQMGRPVGFEDGILEVAFSEEPDFYVKEASNSRHRDALTKVLREKFGIEPRLEFRAANAGSAEPPSPPQPSEPPQPEANPEGSGPRVETGEVSRESGMEAESSANLSSGPSETEDFDIEGFEANEPSREVPEAANGSGSAGSAEADDKIRDEQEVFDLFRENMKRDGGSR